MYLIAFIVSICALCGFIYDGDALGVVVMTLFSVSFYLNLEE